MPIYLEDHINQSTNYKDQFILYGHKEDIKLKRVAKICKENDEIWLEPNGEINFSIRDIRQILGWMRDF